MTKHALLAASRTKQWSVCPGSAAWFEAHPELESGSGFHAQMGTCAHALVERCLATDTEPEEYRDRLIEIIENSDGSSGTSILRKGAKMASLTARTIFVVDTDMIDATEHMVSYIRRRLTETGGALQLESHTVPLPHRSDTGGTADVTIDAWPDVLEVVDYKNGSGVFVPIESNEQLRSYLLGKLQESGLAGLDYKTLRYTICQPRHQQAPFDGIMSEDISVMDLINWGEWLSERADRVDDARLQVKQGATLDTLWQEKYLSTGEDGSHCYFCNLQPQCPAARARVEELAGMDFENDPDVLEETPGPNRLAWLLPWMPFLDKWIKETVASGERFLLTGGTITGQKLVRKKSARKWIEDRNIDGEEEDGKLVMTGISEADIIKELLEDFKLKGTDILTKPKLITGPQAEKLIKGSAERKLFNARLLFKPEAGLTMAPEDDKREAVKVDPSADFEGLED